MSFASGGTELRPFAARKVWLLKAGFRLAYVAKVDNRAGMANLRLLIGFVATSILWLAPPAVAHPGGLAADGCHNDRRNGGRHCHRGPSRPIQTPQKAFGGDVYYPNCAAARAAGAAPIRLGQPGYGGHLDRDGDGKACE